MTSDQPAPKLPEPTPVPAPDTAPPAKTPPATSSGSKTPASKTPPGKPTPAVDQPSKFTRAGALWTALIMGFLVLIVLLIFIAQNTESAEFAFLGWRWSLPLGVAILGAAVGGGLLTVAAGTARIFQLRRSAKKNLKAALRS